MNPETVVLRDESIRLGQLLKLAGLVDEGHEAKVAVEQGMCKVNGEIETRRGRQVRDGDVVEYDGRAVRVSASPAGASPTATPGEPA